MAPAHLVCLPTLFFHKLQRATTAVPGSKGPQTKLRNTHVWFTVAGTAPGEGQQAGDTGRKQQTAFHKLRVENKVGVGMMLHCEAGKGSRYGGHPEERRVCALKIIIDPRGEERLVWE